MNYLIIDTEKTYNIGYLIVSDNKEVLKEKQFVITAHFEDRRICGENNYNRKKKIFSQETNIHYVTPLMAIREIFTDIKQHKIKHILGQQVSEDRIQLGQLIQETKPYLTLDEQNLLNSIEFFDFQKITQLLFPTAQKLNLTDLMNDILGGGFIQTHTALADAKLCWSILEHCIEYMPIFLTNDECHWFQEVSRHIMATVETHFIPTQKLFSDCGEVEDGYTIKAFNNRCHLFAEHGYLRERQQHKIGVKGNTLKTTELAVCSTPKMQIMIDLYQRFRKVKWTEIFHDLAVLQTAESHLELDLFKQSLEQIYKKKEQELLVRYKKKEIELETKYKKKEKELETERTINSLQKKKLDDKATEYDLLIQEAKKGAYLYIQNLNDKRHQKTIKELTKMYKKKQIDLNYFIEHVCELSLSDIKEDLLSKRMKKLG